MLKGAKRRKKHAERAEEVAALAGRLSGFEEAFKKMPKAAAKKEPSGCASEDHARPRKAPDSELCTISTAVHQGLQSVNETVEDIRYFKQGLRAPCYSQKTVADEATKKLSTNGKAQGRQIRRLPMMKE